MREKVRSMMVSFRLTKGEMAMMHRLVGDIQALRAFSKEMVRRTTATSVMIEGLRLLEAEVRRAIQDKETTQKNRKKVGKVKKKAS